MNWLRHSSFGGRLACLLLFLFALRPSAQAQSEPIILSVVPGNFATGISPSAPVVFTFSEPMSAEASGAEFYDSTTFSLLDTTQVWSDGNRVLTCTPNPAFPANKFILWSVSGENPDQDPLGGDTSGGFTTSGSSGGSGSGTNRLTLFSLGKIQAYDQNSTAAPVPDEIAPYGFSATTSLASNRTATGVSLMLPSGSVSNLLQFPTHPEQFFLFTGYTNQAALTATYADGNYTFRVQAATSNQQVTVNFLASLTQPPVPHVANYAAAQSVNAAQPFTLNWDLFQGGTASDYIFVTIEDAYQSPDPGTAGALHGTATSVPIPAGTFQPGTSYEGSIGFYRAIFSTNGSSYATTIYRATITRFTLVTTGATGGPLVLTNASWFGPLFTFEVTSAVGQTFTVESSAFIEGPWHTLLTTNSPNGRVQIMDLQSAAFPTLFYRARNGP